MYSTDDLRPTFATTARLIAGVSPDQWHEPTPCTEWDVRALVKHTTWVVQMFGAATRGEEPPNARDSDVLGDDPVGAFEAAANDSCAAWQARGLDGTIRIPFGEVPAVVGLGICLVDATIHAWDLADATGQDARLDPVRCAELLSFMGPLVPAEPRTGGFGPVVDVGVDASPVDRLLGYSGRKP